MLWLCYLAGGVLGITLGAVVCILGLSLGLAPCTLGLTCSDNTDPSQQSNLNGRKTRRGMRDSPLASLRALLASGSFWIML